MPLTKRKITMTRSESREQAFILIFQNSFKNESFEELIEIAEESGIYISDEYCEKLIHTVIDNADEINSIIKEHLKGWQLDRISRVAQAALKVAVSEMLYFKDIPQGVSINEAVELTKKFSTKEDASFVNGLLGTLSRKSE